MLRLTHENIYRNRNYIGDVFFRFLTVKLWGQSLSYLPYPHPVFQSATLPVEFVQPAYAQLDEAIKGDKNIFLDISVTFDQKLVIPRRAWGSDEKPIRLFKYDEVKSDVILLTDVAEQLRARKIIFNIIENAQAVHQSFMENMRQMKLEKGENFIVTSPFEAPIKALKELSPALVYASTQPEILKIVAMQSMNLIEAVSFRADVILHPLKIRNHDFYNEELLAEMDRRKKKIIIGPLEPSEVEAARVLKPWGIIVNGG